MSDSFTPRCGLAVVLGGLMALQSSCSTNGSRADTSQQAAPSNEVPPVTGPSQPIVEPKDGRPLVAAFCNGSAVPGVDSEAGATIAIWFDGSYVISSKFPEAATILYAGTLDRTTLEALYATLVISVSGCKGRVMNVPDSRDINTFVFDASSWDELWFPLSLLSEPRAEGCRMAIQDAFGLIAARCSSKRTSVPSSREAQMRALTPSMFRTPTANGGH